MSTGEGESGAGRKISLIHAMRVNRARGAMDAVLFDTSVPHETRIESLIELKDSLARIIWQQQQGNIFARRQPVGPGKRRPRRLD